MSLNATPNGAAMPENPPGRFKKFTPHKTVAAMGIAGSLIGIYLPAALSHLILNIWNIYVPAVTFSFLAGIGMVLALVWAADNVRRIAKYGLGTGVPSVGMYGIGIGMIAALFALSISGIGGPIAGLLAAAAIGWVGGWLVNHVIQLKIPSMETRMAEVAAGSMLGFYASFVTIFGETAIVDILTYLITGAIILGFMGCVFVIYHAYNANLGPDESLDRTRTLAALDGFLLMLVLGIVSFVSKDPIGPLVTIFMSIVFIVMLYRKYWTLVKRDAYAVREAGLLPAEEELL
ncbi:tetrahydromethanopterin S-methyltransferase subunit MtrC [Methanolapillus millepedarum]|uniref:Tetrahydromethanopterin S-methyltransferase subunit C n=1 Tax=Methanolapillus millepedarum TaxID=3028296 RepID=A0AA96VFR5_9EURY|nr:hypothetical protein MsAc7_13330 [Methanosarcinaceae archaeon Ac7]